MKYLLLLLAALLTTVGVASAQSAIDTTRGRYHQPVFQQVTVTRAVAYGAAVNVTGTNQTLLLDLYEPTGDTVRRRPLIVFAHEGAFITGTRDDQFMTDICTRFARLGYVTATIDYRIGFFPLDSVNIGRAAIRAEQDMRAAVRFFRQDAATARQYRIHPNYIFAAGSSAGAFMALQLGYLDKASEVPAYINLATLGTIEGSSGNPGYSSQIAAVVNLCGAIGSPSWLEAGNVPLCSVHGTADATVPYNIGKAFGVATAPRIFGSGAIKPRADAVGIPNVLRTLRGAPHVPYDGSGAANLAYFDTTYQTMRTFLRPLLRQAGTALATAPAAAQAAAQLYPVPAEQLLYLEAAAGVPFTPTWLELTDATGRVARRIYWGQPRLLIRREELKAGLYFLRGEGLPARQVVWQ